MSQAFVVAALYRFARLDDHAALRRPLLQCMLDHGVRGSLLLAPEGINGTVAGSAAGVDALLKAIAAMPQLRGFDVKFSHADEMPFNRARVKLKREIVTLGVDGIDPANAGTLVEPADWNRLIDDPEVLVIDTRNDYEVEIGSFAGAVNPETASFREFPAWAERELDPARHKKIAMFCTGGIRCEKSTAYLRQQGFDEVYHLQGGILKYLEEVPEAESLWQGECFVFDTRVAVDRELGEGGYMQCHACRRPLSADDLASLQYREGVSCPHCVDELDADRAARLEERRKQVAIARERGDTHIGPRS